MALLIASIGFGLAAGAVIALGAVGFTVQFGISNVLNIMYGSLMTLAAYLGLFLIDRQANVWVVMAIVGIAVAVCSAAFRRLIVAPLQRRGTRGFGIVIVTVSAAIVLQYVIVAVVGPQAQSYGPQGGATIRLAGMTLSAAQVAIIVGTALLMLGRHLLLTRTKLGRAMRATSANPTLAQSCGIETELVGDLAWLISGALCGAAGVALAITPAPFASPRGSFSLT